MKTKYFSRYTLSDDAKKRISILAGFKKETLDSLAEWFEHLQIYPSFDSSDIRKLSDKTGEGADPLRKAMFAADLLLRRIGMTDDKANDIVSDMVALQILDKPSPLLVEFLDRVTPLAKKYNLMSRISDTAEKGTPSLVATDMSVALKPVFEKNFTYGEDDITKYNPSQLGFAVSAQISLQTEECPQVFSFLLTKESLDRFIAELLALQKEMLVAETTILGSSKK